MSESVNREISAVDSQDLLDRRIGVDDAKNDRVDIRERLIDVLGKNGSGFLVTPLTGWSHLKQLRSVIDQPEDC